MLRLKSLKLVDFGPFKGEQTIAFPPDDGVSVIYGENMRGKTTLLNALRYAFYGRIMGRGRRPGSLHAAGNWEAAEAGRHGFEIVLDMSHEGRDYRLTRSCRPPPGVAPASDEDYAADFYLERDGHIMSRKDAEDEMKRILPEQVARFFLFDGELLQEYEDLLHSDSDMGPKISGAIERILGIPVLTGARDSIKAARTRAEQRQALAAQGDQKTRTFGNELANIHISQQEQGKELERLGSELEGLKAEKTAIEEEMRKRERTASLLDKRDRLVANAETLQKRRASQEEKLKTAMGSAWAIPLTAALTAAVDRLKVREADLQTAVTRTRVLAELAHLEHADCPTCLQRVSAEARDKIRVELDGRGGSTGEADERELVAVRRRLEAVAATAALANPHVLRELWDSNEQIERDMFETHGEIEELTRQLAEGKDEDVRRLRASYENVIRGIKATEDGVSATRDEYERLTGFKENLQRKLAKASNGSLDAESRKVDLLSDLHALFDRGVTVFREQLRRKVEGDATRHFRALTTEPEYASLRINDAYGLTIIHENGSEIPVRSAGAEHVVALSLVGALQNNAPLRGPIVIDSPFGRLDGGHRARIVEALPGMAKQVVLLVYEEEMPPQKARSALKGRLHGEWTLRRESARHTVLEPTTEEQA